MATWWLESEEANQAWSVGDLMPGDYRRASRAWGLAWETWVSGLSISRTRALQYALLHLLRYDRNRGPVPITTTARLFMRYNTARE